MNIQAGDLLKYDDGVRYGLAIVICRSTAITIEPMIILSWIDDEHDLNRSRFFGINELCSDNNWSKLS